MWLTAVAVLLLFFLSMVLYGAAKRQLWVLVPAGGKEGNPFKEPAKKRLGAALVTDQKARDKILKQSFSADRVPSDLDAIVVGSGIGGLSTAAILAKVGKKVLVLEQHDQAGGCCHTYVEKGFEFDVGIHYIGEMAEGTLQRTLLDQITESGTEWVKLEEVYDDVIIGESGDPEKRKTYPIPSGRGKLMESLIQNFPGEEKAIRKYFDILKHIRKSMTFVVLLKVLPLWLVRLFISSSLLQRLVPALTYFRRSLSEVLDSLTDNKELKAVLAYSFGDYGTVPKEASFGMQAVLTNHFTHGGYYPIGGASEIAFNIIPTIEAAGGRVLVRAKVVDIIWDNEINQVTGVHVKQGQNVYEIVAPLVISDAGLHNTLGKLLPQKVVKNFGLKDLVKRVRPGFGLMSVFIGLDGTKEELGLKASNVWAFTNPDLDKTLEKFVHLSPEEAAAAPVPLMFVSFPSTKDPAFNDRYPGKSTCAIVTVTPYEWFEQWKEERVLHRGQDYDQLKNAIAMQMWKQVCDLFPQIADRKEYFEVGTPLSNVHYLGTTRGEVYGVDHDTVRFSMRSMADLRPEIGVPGLFLTGQDIFICGFGGAMMGGLICAATILQRNLLNDLIKLKTKINKKQD